ncbi:MAG TPA: hypothetical protein VM939_00710 [Gemmatimonadaceae bacterium]|nr:hypothetical protein [Gemmatimonadaceae bacterium]
MVPMGTASIATVSVTAHPHTSRCLMLKLARTLSGRWDPAKPRDRSLGVHPTVAEWLHKRGVAAVGDEGGTDMSPTPVAGINSPFHVLALVGMGMPLIENLDLERLAREAATRSRWTFLFVAAPLRVQAATGSALNPLAVF